MSAPQDGVRVRDGAATTAVVAAWERERRALVRRGLGLGGALVAAGAVPMLWRVRTAFAQADGDAEVLRAAVALEQAAAFAYERIVDRRLVDAPLLRTARTFAAHEREHADALAAALRSMGGDPPAPPRSPEDAGSVAAGLAELSSTDDVLTFAIELEGAAIAAYHDAHRRLRDARLLQTAAAIMGCEGQHLMVLRRASGRVAIPRALETGVVA